MAVTSPGVGFTTRRLGKTTRRVEQTNRRLVRATSPTMPMAWICPFLRARVYVFDFPKKAFTPSHGTCFLLIFIAFECEGLDFQVFTLEVNACEGLKYQAFTPESHWKSAEKRQKRHSGGEHFEIKAFTLESSENQA